MKLFPFSPFLFGAALLFNVHAATNVPAPLQVKVLDAAGQPVEGATVVFYGSADNMLSLQGMPQTEERRTTDANGLASFSMADMPLFTLVAHKPGLSLGWKFCFTGMPEGDTEDKVLELSLSAPTTLSGIIQDPNGKPVPGAEVWVSFAYQPAGPGSQAFNILNSKQGRQFLSTRSGEDGRFLLEGLPSDATCELGAAKPGLALDQLPPNIDPSDLSLRAGQSNIVLTLKPAGMIEGRVVEETTGEPVAGARVSLASVGLMANIQDPVTTGADGRFRLENLCAGEHILRTTVGTNQFADWVCEQVTAQVETGATNRNVKIIASRGGVLEVTLRDSASNRPLERATVIAAPEDNDVFSIATAAKPVQGVARFRLPPGNYLLITAEKEFRQRQDRTTVEKGQTNQLDVTLSPDQKITGTVLDRDGKPAPKIQIISSSSPRGSIRSDAEGRFTLMMSRMDSSFNQGQQPENMIMVRDPDHNLAAFAILDEDTTNLVLRLEPGLILAGRVVDTQAKSITNAQIHMSLSTDRSGIALGELPPINPNGSFEMKGLPPNHRYYISVRAKGYGQDNRNVAAHDTAGPRLDLDIFELPAANQRIAGVVLDADDKPVAGASIYTYGAKQPNKSSRTDVKGRFSIAEVCAGAITVSANTSRGRAHGNTVAEGGDTNITVRLGVSGGFVSSSSTGTGKLSGTVIGPDGKPASKVVVSFFPFHGTEKVTDEEGQFKLTFNADEWRHTQNIQRVVIARAFAQNLAAALDVEADATNAEVRLEPAWTVAGRVTGEDGKVLANADVSVSFFAGSIGSTLGQPIRPEKDGRFEIKGLPAGRRYYINVSAPGHGRDNRNLQFDEAETRLELEPFQLIKANQRVAGVVVDENDKPVAGANLYCYENNQPDLNGQTDSKGRFHFDNVCPGSFQLNVSSQSAYTRAMVNAGDTNIVIQISSSPSGRPSAPRAASLKGKVLPDLAPLGLAAADAPAEHPLLVLLMDAEQRPSRRALKVVESQAAMLKDKEVAVLVIQAGAMAEDAFTAWKEEAALAFPVGRIQDKLEKARAAWGASALPWLILTDKNHRVVAEGFAPEEIETKLSTP